MEGLKNVPHEIDIWEENKELRIRLDESEETLRAIRDGEIADLIVNSNHGEQVFTLLGADDHIYRVLIEAMNEGALTLTADGIILYCNRSFAGMMLTPQQELIGSSFYDFLYPNDLCKLQADIANNKGMVRREMHLSRRDGSQLAIFLSMNSVSVEELEILSLVITDLSGMKERANELELVNNQLRHEITERQRAEADIRQSEEKFSRAFNGMPIMMALATMKEGRFIDVNEALCSQSGYNREEFIGHTSIELNLFPYKMRPELFDRIMEKGRLDNYELDLCTKFGEMRKCLCWIQLLNIDEKLCHITGMIDITEKKRVEASITRLDRLNLIGEMAASIGHEIRNPMTAVRGFIQLLNEQEYYAKDKIYFDLMIEELDRANEIISEYLGMARNKPIDLQTQYLDQIVKGIYPLIEADANHKGMNIELDLCKPPMPLLDKNEIRQLILNMARNGMDAMSEGGTLTIGTTTEVSEIVLFIKDEGQGLPPELLDKLGTPFLTTKTNGTGLGLAVCYSIAARHNARIDYETGPKGTTFKVYFPSENDQITLF